MKKVFTILMLLMAFFMPFAANAYNHQVQVGYGEEYTMQYNYTPINYDYNYAYAQMIYTAAQINNDGCNYAGDIESISFYCPARTFERTAPITVYMKTTTKSAFTNSSTWESVTENDIYYEGNLSVTDAGCWYTITFDRPFAYNGTSNLLIAIYKEQNPDETPQEVRWQHSQVSGNQVIYKNSSTPLNLSSLGTATSRQKAIPNIIFNMTLSNPFPTHVTLDDASGSTATISWTAPQTTNTISHYAYEYTAGSTTLTGTTTSTTVDLSDLTSETNYQFQVQAVYSDGESCWSTLDFSTLEDCPTPRNLEANNITDHSAEISWFGSGPDSYTVEIGIPGNNTVIETILSEGFEDGDLPEGWTTTTQGGWEVLTGLDYDDGEYVFVDPATGVYNAANAYNQDDFLITPAIDLSIASSATLSFNVLNPDVYGDLNSLTVHYRVDGGEWNELLTIDDAVDSWQAVSISLEGLAANYQIGFECICDWGMTGIDDVEIVAEVPEFTWIAVHNDVSKPFALSNLTPETTYGVRVNGVCGGEPGEKSDVLIITTLPSLPSFTKTIEAYNESESEKGGYYLIASPLANTIAPTEVGGMITDNLGSTATPATSAYDLYSFDQAQDLEWLNYRANAFNLVNGQGYLYASKEGTTLTFIGAPGTNGEVTLHKTAEATGLDFPDWNLVGNPFGEGAYITKPFYTLENSDTYTTNTAGTRIQAMQGLLVVADSNGETLTFTTEVPAGKVAKLNMNLSKDRNVVDHAIVSFNEGQQLPKLQFRNGSSKVYMPKDGKDYAIVSAESNMGEMSVSFKAENNGTYTLSFTTEEVSFAYLHLIDNMTGNDVDLLANPSYSFEAKTTDYESRFKLVFATGNNANDDAFAFFSNGSFVINNEGNATLQVIDVNGRIVKNESINGCANVNVNAASGVYMLRLVNGNDVKVQKVVVR